MGAAAVNKREAAVGVVEAAAAGTRVAAQYMR